MEILFRLLQQPLHERRIREVHRSNATSANTTRSRHTIGLQTHRQLDLAIVVSFVHCSPEFQGRSYGIRLFADQCKAQHIFGFNMRWHWIPQINRICIVLVLNARRGVSGFFQFQIGSFVGVQCVVIIVVEGRDIGVNMKPNLFDRIGILLPKPFALFHHIRIGKFVDCYVWKDGKLQRIVTMIILHRKQNEWRVAFCDRFITSIVLQETWDSGMFWHFPVNLRKSMRLNWNQKQITDNKNIQTIITIFDYYFDCPFDFLIKCSRMFWFWQKNQWISTHYTPSSWFGEVSCAWTPVNFICLTMTVYLSHGIFQTIWGIRCVWIGIKDIEDNEKINLNYFFRFGRFGNYIPFDFWIKYLRMFGFWLKQLESIVREWRDIDIMSHGFGKIVGRGLTMTQHKSQRNEIFVTDVENIAIRLCPSNQTQFQLDFQFDLIFPNTQLIDSEMDIVSHQIEAATLRE